jgi:hypothetical protein
LALPLLNRPWARSKNSSLPRIVLQRLLLGGAVEQGGGQGLRFVFRGFAAEEVTIPALDQELPGLQRFLDRLHGRRRPKAVDEGLHVADLVVGSVAAQVRLEELADEDVERSAADGLDVGQRRVDAAHQGAGRQDVEAAAAVQRQVLQAGRRDVGVQDEQVVAAQALADRATKEEVEHQPHAPSTREADGARCSEPAPAGAPARASPKHPLASASWLAVFLQAVCRSGGEGTIEGMMDTAAGPASPAAGGTAGNGKERSSRWAACLPLSR